MKKTSLFREKKSSLLEEPPPGMFSKEKIFYKYSSVITVKTETDDESEITDEQKV